MKKIMALMPVFKWLSTRSVPVGCPDRAGEDSCPFPPAKQENRLERFDRRLTEAGIPGRGFQSGASWWVQDLHTAHRGLAPAEWSSQWKSTKRRV